MSEPKAMTAKFEGFILKPSYTLKGPFRVVLLRDGGLYRSFLCPTGQDLITKPMILKNAQQKAEGLFMRKLEDWAECAPSRGLPV